MMSAAEEKQLVEIQGQITWLEAELAQRVSQARAIELLARLRCEQRRFKKLETQCA